MDEFGNRMKSYENAYRIYLPKRMPMIIRIDGSHFHTYTRGIEKPVDERLAKTFWETCKYLVANIPGAKLAYHQSDEISLLITNYDKLTTQPWFDNNLQKIVSNSVSMATAKFNEEIKKYYPEKELAIFDSRTYVLPLDEVNNYFLWRQNDSTKNSISMLAQANFKHSDLQGLKGSQMQDKLFLEKGISWNDLPVWKKRGVCIKRMPYTKNGVQRNKVDVDYNIPIFSQETNYVNQNVFLNNK